MVSPLIEPIVAGIVVSLINKYLLNTNSFVYSYCNDSSNVYRESEDLTSSTNTTISDRSSLETPHIHSHI